MRGASNGSNATTDVAVDQKATSSPRRRSPITETPAQSVAAVGYGSNPSDSEGIKRVATKLNQILAVSKGVKSDATRAFTDAHRDVQKQPLLSGISRTYQPKDDEGDKLPPESTRVQLTAQKVIADVKLTLARLFDVVATQDYANCRAVADITVDGTTVATAVPVTYLLFLEKQLVDLHTFIAKLPILDPSENWTFNETAGHYAADPVQTNRSQKVMRNHVAYEATKEHPAQVQVYTEDVVAGTWTTIKFSGALPATHVSEMLARVTKLQEAVKMARETANATEVTDQRIGAGILGYVLGT